MNRIEFMSELERLLKDIPAEEREEALHFYDEYFADAGAEHEQDVILELESPGKAAQTIKAGLKADPEGGEFTETGYRETFGSEQPEQHPAPNGYNAQQEQQNRQSYQQPGGSKRDGWSKLAKIALIVAVIVLAWPLILAALSVIFGLGVSILAVFFSLIVASIVLVIVGAALIVTGIILLIPQLAVGIALLGVGCVLTGLGLLATYGSIKLSAAALPGIFRFAVEMCRRLLGFGRKVVA